MDQKKGDAGPRSVEDLFQQRVRQRLALYGANPSETAIQEAIKDIQLQDARQERERERQERERERQERERERQKRELERQHEWRMAVIRQSETTPKEPAAMEEEFGRRLREMQGGEAGHLPPQQLTRADGVESPAEVLATGQSGTHLCPAPETTVEFQGAGAVGPSPQQQAEVVKLLPPAESLAAGQNATGRCTQLPLERISVDGTAVSTHSNPAEELATEPSATGLGSQLTEEGVPVVLDGTSVLTDTTPENGVTLRQEDVSLALQALGDFHLPQVDGTSVSTCIPQGCRAVDPDPQQHDGLSPVTLSSLQRQKGLQGEGPVQASPQRRVCSLREAEVGWVSDSLFGEIYLGYCVDTGIRRRDLWTNFGVNPSGVPPSVSLLPKGERCNGKARGTQNRLGSMKYPCASFPNGSYVSITLCLY